jgi:putative transposase
MPQNYLALWYHLIWTTKNREPLLDKKWKWELYAHIKTFCTQKEYHLDFINGVEDHLHLLISPKPQFALSDVVRDIKRDSYYWVKEKGYCQDYFGWQDGYGALTVSPSHVQQIRNYIKKQEKHHKTHSFESELEQLKFVIENYK